MEFSRRDFFAQVFGKAVKRIPEAIPDGVSNVLGIESKKAATAEEAAFMLANSPRKKTLLESLTRNFPPDNTRSIVKDKPDNA